MKLWRQVLFSPDEGEGGGGEGEGGGGDAGGGQTAPPDWKASLDPELRDSPILKDYKDVASMAKSHVEAQKLLGHKRTALPDKNWTQAQYDEFYKAIGRPESADKYTVPKVPLPEGVTLPEENVKAAKEAFHKLGMTGPQFEGALKWYLEYIDKGYKTAQEELKTQAALAETKLKEEWGDEYQARSDMARAAIRQYASEEFLAYMDSAGLGNNPELIKMFAKIGEEMMEDTVKGRGSGHLAGSAGHALITIEELKTNKEFMDALLTGNHPGHAGAVARWHDLHKQAHGTAVVAPA